MTEVTKSSKEILTELFDSFDADPPSSLSETVVDSSESSHEDNSKDCKGKLSKKKKKLKKSKSQDSKRTSKKKKRKKKHKRKSSHSGSESDSSVGSKRDKSKSKKIRKRPRSTSPSNVEDVKSKKKTTEKSVSALDILSAELSTECSTLFNVEPLSGESSSNIGADNEASTSVHQTGVDQIELPKTNPQVSSKVSFPVPAKVVKKDILLAKKFKSSTVEENKEEIKKDNAKTEELDVNKKSNGMVALKVADVFVEDLLASGEKSFVESLTAPVDKSKISIKITDLKKSSVLEAAEAQAKIKAEKLEEGEISDSSRQSSSHSLSDATNKGSASVEDLKLPEHEKKKKHKHQKHKKSDKRSPSSERESSKKHRSLDKSSRGTSRSSDHSKSRKERARSHERKCRRRSRSRGRERVKARSRSRSKEKRREESEKKRGDRRDEKGDKRDEKGDKRREKSRDRHLRKSRSPLRHRSRRSHSRTRRKSRSRSRLELNIDKNKLLEIARKNALSMLKQGTVGSDVNKMAAITAGGKTVDELTDFCKLLSQKDATGQESLSSGSCHSSDTESEKPFHHPFLLKERPNSIIMNIRNCAALPVKTHQEKTAEHAQQLRLQFPVSSGQQHRKTENEWVPVSPKAELKAIACPEENIEEKIEVINENSCEEIPPPSFIVPPLPPDLPPAFQPPPQEQPLLDIGDIVSQRLTAMRKLQDDPHDPMANEELKEVQNKMKLWAESKNQPGLFTGTTGVRVLSQAELASGQQAWAKKDQLISAQPVSGGMGMSLLQKMGWKPGEGLGKHNEGTLEPLKLPVKMDKRGLVCAEELPRRQQQILGRRVGPPPPKPSTLTHLEGKHPVSLLVEFCTKRRFAAPAFSLCSEDGPSHKKSFIFKVVVDGVEYKSSQPCPNKKLAKSEAATACLRQLGVLPNL